MWRHTKYKVTQNKNKFKLSDAMSVYKWKYSIVKENFFSWSDSEIQPFLEVTFKKEK